MGLHYLPSILRPDREGHPLRTGAGGDIARFFYDAIKAIDPNLYFVWHPYRVMYDNVMNQYLGMYEDARFCIHEEFGEEVWGYAYLKPKLHEPIPECRWHLWRLCDPYGWCHVSIVESHDDEYLVLLANRLHKQAVFSDRYSQKEYAKMVLKDQEAYMEKQKDDADQLYSDVQKENAWLTRRAMDNMHSGKTAPTTPTKEIITNISPKKIVRPITDTEGGLVLPDSWKNE